MHLYQQQEDNERLFAKENKAETLKMHKDVLMAPCLAKFEADMAIEVEYFSEEGEFREDLAEISHGIEEMDAERVIWNILSTVILDGQITLQGIMGMYFEQIDVAMAFRKGRVLEPFIEAVLVNPLVSFKRVGKYLSLVREGELKLDITNYAYVLPPLMVEPVVTNGKAGYDTIPFHVITGGKLKQHGGEVCLDHINRLNAVQYTVDNRIFSFTQPKFNAEPKYLEKIARYESELEVNNRRKQFNLWLQELPEKLAVLRNTGNTFYYKHRYCIRGRSYLKAWHLDFIGNKFIRALVNTTDAEAIEGADYYIK